MEFNHGDSNVKVQGRTDRHTSSREAVKVIPEPLVSGYAVSEDLSPYRLLAVASGKPTSGLPVNRPQS